MARYSTVRSDSIEYSFWLVFGVDGSLHMTRGEPNICRGERAMHCSATLPKSLFKTPELRATIGVNDTTPSELNIDVAAAGDALRQVVGCDIDLQVIKSEGG